MNQEKQTPIEHRLSVAGLRKLRDYYLENIAQAANEIKAIDVEIEALNMANLGDDGL